MRKITFETSQGNAEAIKYREILKLRKFCDAHGVEARLERAFDGYVLRFNNGADFTQHHGTDGSDVGCVEPAGISKKLDYTAVPLEKAKALVRYYKDKLNKKRSENGKQADWKMAEVIAKADDTCRAQTIAEALYNADYRKADEVAAEIFAEIEDVLNNIGYFDELDFKALKKKYTESEDAE